jgi:hypothetical protein
MTTDSTTESNLKFHDIYYRQLNTSKLLARVVKRFTSTRAGSVVNNLFNTWLENNSN